MKLFYHLFGYLLLGMLTVISLAEYLSFQEQIKQFEKDLIANAIQNGTSLSGILAHVWQEGGKTQALTLLEDASARGTLHIRWLGGEELGQAVARLGGKQETRAQLAGGEPCSLKVSAPGEDQRLYTYVPVSFGSQASNGALELCQRLQPLTVYSKQAFVRACGITFSLALAFGVILYLFIHRNIRVPLMHLTQQAQDIAQGNFAVAKSIEGHDELAIFARTMNEMCSRLVIAQEKIKFECNARLKTVEQLRHTERLSTFGLISAGIAHEIGTPLNIVDGRAKMILRDGLNADQINKCAEIIQNQAERMTVIIRQLLDFSQRSEKHIAQENISLLVKQVFQFLQPMAHKQGIHFSLAKAEGAEVLLMADGSQIQQVLINLMMNSIQAMPHGGQVNVSLSNETLPRIQANNKATPMPMLKVRIEDEGEGISKEHLDKIFTPFFTTKNIGTGTGLGLSIAHGIVDEHGGWIEAENKEQTGACFSIYLPLQEQQS